MESLEDLQRNLQKLEANKRMVMEKMESENRRQRADIDLLTRESMKLKREHNELKALQSMSQNAAMGSKINKLVENNVTIDVQCKMETQRQFELQDKLRTLHEQIARCRERMGTLGGVNAAKETNESVHKQIRVLESRLDKALQRFNETVAVNKDLRQQIDYLRRERAVFDGIYRKLEQELQDRRKHIATMIEIANNAYNARDQAQQQMLALKRREEEEHAAFDACITRLTESLLQERTVRDELRTLDSEEALAKFNNTGGNHNATGGSNMALGGTSLRPATQPNAGGAGHNLSNQLRGGLRSAATGLGGGRSMQRDASAPLISTGAGGMRARGGPGGSSMVLVNQNGTLSHDMSSGSIAAAERDRAMRAATLEDAFAKVQAATGIADLDELVRAFASAEDQNFSLFSYANEQAAEVDNLQEEIQTLRADLDAIDDATRAQQLQGHVVAPEVLQEQIEKAQLKTLQLLGSSRQAEKTLSSLRSGILAIFSRLGCSLQSQPTTAQQQQQQQSGQANNGASGGANEGQSGQQGSSPAAPPSHHHHNHRAPEVPLLTYLSIIEQRTNEMLARYRAKVLAVDPGAEPPAPLGSTEAPGFFPRGAGATTVMEVAETMSPGQGRGASAGVGARDGGRSGGVGGSTMHSHHHAGDSSDSDEDLTVEVMTRQQLTERAQRDIERAVSRDAAAGGVTPGGAGGGALGRSGALSSGFGTRLR